MHPQWFQTRRDDAGLPRAYASAIGYRQWTVRFKKWIHNQYLLDLKQIVCIGGFV